MHYFRQPKKWITLFSAAMMAVSPGLLPILSVHQTADAATPYVLDAANHTVTVNADSTDDAGAIGSALSYLATRSDKATPWTLKLTGGKYSIAREIRADYLQNVNIVSDRANPATLVKDPNGRAEYIFYFRFAKNLSMSGMTFYGKTTFANDANPVWGEQGVYLGSCNGVTVDWNRFYNFGDAALRVTTDYYDPIKGVDSFNTKVTNNIFNNIYQISTTSNDDVHGATANYLFQWNTVANLRGSVKFASRTPGATNVRVRDNVINGGDHFGLEINNYTNFTIANNKITNIKEVPITVYTDVRATSNFTWGSDFSITGNTISNSQRGIRFAPNAYPSGYTFIPKNVIISGNTLSNITSTDPYMPAIGVFKGTVDGLTIADNKMSSLTNKKAVGYTTSCTNVKVSNNLLDNVLYLAMKF